MTNSFAVMYRMGGTMTTTWRRVGDNYESRFDAQAKVHEIERMGYRAIMMPTAQADSTGMPIGWDAQSVNHDLDQIEIIRHNGVMVETRWISHELRKTA